MDKLSPSFIDMQTIAELNTIIKNTEKRLEVLRGLWLREKCNRTKWALQGRVYKSLLCKLQAERDRLVNRVSYKNSAEKKSLAEAEVIFAKPATPVN